MLAGRPILSFCVKDVEISHDIITRVLHLQFEQKPSIQDLIRKWFLDYYNCFRGFQPALPDTCKELTSRISWEYEARISWASFNKVHTEFVRVKLEKDEKFLTTLASKSFQYYLIDDLGISYPKLWKDWKKRDICFTGDTN
jgi:hypothetical protein